MKRCLPICVVVLVQLAFSFYPLKAQPPAAGSASLTVQVDKPGIKVSPTLYGIFFEEINHAGDGGLYAELVQNRSFENSDKPDCWTLVTDGSGKGEMAIDKDNPMCENNPRSPAFENVLRGRGKSRRGERWLLGHRRGKRRAVRFVGRPSRGRRICRSSGRRSGQRR